MKYLEEAGAVTVLGLSKHSKDAAEGVNAIVGLLKASWSSLTFFIADAVGEDATGAALFAKSKMNQVVFPSILQPSPLINSNLKSGIGYSDPCLSGIRRPGKRLSEVAASYQLQYEEIM